VDATTERWVLLASLDRFEQCELDGLAGALSFGTRERLGVSSELVVEAKRSGASA
jgi:hypothetical protein